MAPKIRVSSSTSGSGGCSECTAPLYLYGWDWKSQTENSTFGFAIIAAIVLIGCFIAAFFFKWARPSGKDRLRTGIFIKATFWGIVYFVLLITDIGLREAETTTIHLYYLTYIVADLAWRFSDILILVLIFWTVAKSSEAPLTRRLPLFTAVPLLVLAIISAATFGMATYENVQLIEGNASLADIDSLYLKSSKVILSYDSLYFILCIFAGMTAAYVYTQIRTTATLLMLFPVAPMLILRAMIPMIYDAIYLSYEEMNNVNFTDFINLSWANPIIYSLTTIAVFGGVAAIAILQPEMEREKTHLGYEQPHVSAV